MQENADPATWHLQSQSVTSQPITRMVRLPATAAIEYVAAVDTCLIYIISSV